MNIKHAYDRLVNLCHNDHECEFVSIAFDLGRAQGLKEANEIMADEGSVKLMAHSEGCQVSAHFPKQPFAYL